MKVYAFVGPSGTGKSHNSQNVAYKNNIKYIIDDALLIKGNKVIAGRSAKTEPTKIGSVKAALFTDESRRDIMKKAIKAEKIESILILGTSDKMVKEIQENLDLPEIEDMPNEVVFDLDKNDKVLKVIPLIKDIDNPEDISNKFKLGIITSTIETIKDDHNSDHNNSL